MRIYNVVESYADRFTVDPDRGVVQRRELVMQASSVDRIVHETGTYEVQPDGTFDVPSVVAAHFLRQPGWHEGSNPFPPSLPEPPAPSKPSARRAKLSAV